MSSVTVTEQRTWLSAREVERLIGLPRAIVPRLAAEGLVTTRKPVVGSPARYLLADVERLIVPRSAEVSA